MTPAVNFLKKNNIHFVLHEYELTGEPENYGQAVADLLDVNHERLFKTLLISLNGETNKLAVCIVPVSTNLNLKLAAKTLKVKKVEMANPTIAETVSGYVVGGISPFGQKKRLPTLIDSTALSHKTLYASGGRRGLQVEVNPNDLIKWLSAQPIDLTS